MNDAGSSDSPANAVRPPESPQPAQPVTALEELAFVVRETPSLPPPPYRRASMESRIGTALLDSCLFSAVVAIVMMFLHGFHFDEAIQAAFDLTSSQLDDATTLIVGMAWLLFTATEVIGRATPGRFLLDLRIATVRFAPASRQQRLNRWLQRRSAAIAWVAVFSLNVVGDLHGPSRFESTMQIALVLLAIALHALIVFSFVWAGSKDKLALYDRLTGTAVIKVADAKAASESAFAVISSTAQDDAPSDSG